MALQGNDTFGLAKECGTITVEHGSVEPAKMLFGDEGVVTCLPGCTTVDTLLDVLVPSATEFTSTCLLDGSLSQSDLVCLPKPCGVPPQPFSSSRHVERTMVSAACREFRDDSKFKWVALDT